MQWLPGKESCHFGLAAMGDTAAMAPLKGELSPKAIEGFHADSRAYDSTRSFLKKPRLSKNSGELERAAARQAGQAGPAPTCCRSAGPTATCCRRIAHETSRHRLERLVSSVFRNSPKNSCRRCRLGQCKYAAWRGAIFVNPISQRKKCFLAGAAPEKSLIFSGDW